MNDIRSKHRSEWLRPLLETVGFVACAAAIVGALVYVRRFLGLQATSLIEPTWLVLAFLPLVIWLIASGRLAEFAAGPIKAKINKVSVEPVSTILGESVESGLVRNLAMSKPEEELKEVAK